jgi:RND family efflux transporter MFP subunit
VVYFRRKFVHQQFARSQFFITSMQTLVKALKVVIPLVLLLGGIAFLLLQNKATMEAKAEQSISLIPAVTTQTAEEQTVSESIEVVGVLQPLSEVSVISETQGRILKVFVNLGDDVKAGSALVKVDSELKYSALLTAKATHEKAQRDATRIRELRTENNAAESELENADITLQNAKAQLIAAERQMRDTRVTSPISGTIVERPVNVGAMLSPGTPIATVVDGSRMKLRANLPEQEITHLHINDRVKVRVNVLPNDEFQGTVTFISIRGDAAHNYPIEIALPNNGRLKSGMTAKMRRTANAARQTLVIPRLAVIGSLKSPQIFVIEQVNGKAVAKRRSVQLGVERSTNIEVVSGLQRGERVVTSGQNNVRDGAEVVVQ